MEQINTRKIKVSSFSSEIEKPLNRNLRTLVTVETDIFETALQDRQDGTFNEVYKAKCVGSVIVQQQGIKEKYVGKSKKTPSQRLRSAFWSIQPEEEFYQLMMDKIIFNLEEVIQFLRSK